MSAIKPRTKTTQIANPRSVAQKAASVAERAAQYSSRIYPKLDRLQPIIEQEQQRKAAQDEFYRLKNLTKLRKNYANPVQKQARKCVETALLCGKITRRPCEICGKLPAQAHHWSYEREHWLDVIWLCQSCHSKEGKK